MSWAKEYDKINTTFDGDLAVFGDHYSIKEAKEIMNKEEWDDETEINKFKKVGHVWLHFGFITNDDGERSSGWKVLDKEPKDKRGCIKATMVCQEKLNILK